MVLKIGTYSFRRLSGVGDKKRVPSCFGSGFCPKSPALGGSGSATLLQGRSETNVPTNVGFIHSYFLMSIYSICNLAVNTIAMVLKKWRITMIK